MTKSLRTTTDLTGDPPTAPGERESTGTAVIERAVPERSWRVILFDDDDHFIHVVERQVQLATGCSLEVAEHAVNEVMRHGSAPVYEGDRIDCERVAGVLSQIALRIDVTSG